MKKVDLSDLKVGDKAWSAAIGECRVTCIYVNVIQCNGTHEHNFDGTCYEEDDIHPTLFHSEQEFREYWGLELAESNQLTKREQFAMAAMQGLLSANKHWSCGEILASCSVQYADALITKLNEKP
jgi:hypothetical protein